jgi:hypothetical protein
MARKPDPQVSSASQAELLEQFKSLIAGMGSDELHGLLPQILAAAEVDPFARPPVPSRRRARRGDVATYRVRIDLTGTTPPLWRRLELASDMFLNELHDVIQTAFGWTDSHLHEFASGKDYYDASAEHYLCPFQAAEGETGVPEEDVRLDEVLAEPRDRLFYEYDFGDGWMHVVKLEAVQPRDEAAARAVCIGGRRSGPSEDCGGVDGYELITAALDRSHPDHAEAVAEYAQMYGDDVDPGDYAPTPFDAEEINATLAGFRGDARDLPGPLGDLVASIRSTPHRRLFQQLIDDAMSASVDIDANTAAQMVSPYTWLLERVGKDGIKLTGSGYLPPTHVEAAVAELGLHEEWIGKGNREIQTLPVLHLRESAQTMGLLRKYRGKLVLTPRGRAVRNDPLALWWHLAEQMPLASNHANETQAGLIYMATVATQSAEDDANATVADLLSAIGWASPDGTPVTPYMAGQAAWDTKTVLRRLGALIEKPGTYQFVPTPQGVTFAQAALQTWPTTI